MYYTLQLFIYMLILLFLCRQELSVQGWLTAAASAMHGNHDGICNPRRLDKKRICLKGYDSVVAFSICSSEQQFELQVVSTS